MTTGQGLRDQKKAETRAALRAATTRLFLERGPAEVTVSDICAAARVSSRTFFNYFDSKEEALIAWDRHVVQDLISAFETRHAGAPIVALHQALDTVLPQLTSGTDWLARAELLDAHPGLREKIVSGLSRNEVQLAEALADHFDLPATSVYPRLLAGAVMAALRAAIFSWAPTSGPEGLRTLVDEAFGQLRSGLPGPERTVL
jgi:AcrR family transcriptional regulator